MSQVHVVRPHAHALWALGFRPFFLGAGMLAWLFLLLWTMVYSRGEALVNYYGAGMFWHGHEMIFGYTVAVIAGFLLTAVRNWTGRDTAHGTGLFWLVLLWLAGRIAPLLDAWLPGSVIALLDLAFLPALVATLLPPLRASQQPHNLRLLVVLALLAVANLLVHLQALGVTQASAQVGLYGAVYLIVLLIAVIVGRVLPFFTERGIAGAQPHQWPWLERATLALTALLALVLPWQSANRWLGSLCLLAAVLHALRAAAWIDRRMWAIPILWVLHVGYAWVAVGFALTGLAAWGMGTPLLALHAFTVGAVGTLTLGMMARVALGHTGRDMRAEPLVTWSFILLTLAAATRVLLPVFVPQWYAAGVMISGVGWSLAFVLFVLVYAPILAQPRVDGRPG